LDWCGDHRPSSVARTLGPPTHPVVSITRSHLSLNRHGSQIIEACQWQSVAPPPPLGDGPNLQQGQQALMNPSESICPAATSNQLFVEPVAPLPRVSDRCDAPQLYEYSRGSKKRALDTLTDETLLAGAVEALNNDVFASSASAPRAAELRTWLELALKVSPNDASRLTDELVRKVCAALKAANFRSIGSYVSIAKLNHSLLHGELPASIPLLASWFSRSGRRGQGPAKHTKELPFWLLKSLAAKPTEWCAGGPLFPRRTIIVSSWWLVWELEFSCARASGATFTGEGRSLTATRLLPTSKRDPEGLGKSRSLSCACLEMSETMCPAHLLLSQHRSQWQQGKSSALVAPSSHCFHQDPEGHVPKSVLQALFNPQQSSTGLASVDSLHQAGPTTPCCCSAVPGVECSSSVRVCGHCGHFCCYRHSRYQLHPGDLPPVDVACEHCYDEGRMYDVACEHHTGTQALAGHAMRATGAIALAESGIAQHDIALFGRWKSEAFKRYVRRAPLKAWTALASQRAQPLLHQT
jgi:hypothetical protein